MVSYHRRIKEQHCYCAPDLAKEYSKYDRDPRKFFRMYTGKRVSELHRTTLQTAHVLEDLEFSAGAHCHA